MLIPYKFNGRSFVARIAAYIFRSLTVEESASVAKRIPEIMAGGLPEAQAVAMSLKELVPEKVRSALYREGAGVKTVQGYRSEQAEDGTWSIFDLPIFSVHKDERFPDDVVDFDSKWLEKALSKNLLRQSEGYLAPLHMVHHGQEGVKAAGFFRMTSIRDHKHEGEVLPTIFADFVGVRPEAYEAIRRGELPYRSVEILDHEANEIDSLALLDHEVPYFRYALLTISEESRLKGISSRTNAQGQNVFDTAFSSPVVAQAEARNEGEVVRHSCAVGNFRAYSYRFGEVKKMEPETPEEEKNEEGGMTIEKVVALVMAMQAQIAKIMAKLGLAEDEEETAIDETPPMQNSAAPVEMPAPVASTESAITKAAAAGQLASVNARIKKLEGLIAKKDYDAEVERVGADLLARGFNADHVKAFKDTCNKDGLAAGRAFSSALLMGGPKEPPKTWTGETSYNDADGPEVLHYAARGPEALDKARSFKRSWDKGNVTVPLKEYLEICFDPHQAMNGARR